jgi:hypothetical protein
VKFKSALLLILKTIRIVSLVRKIEEDAQINLTANIKRDALIGGDAAIDLAPIIDDDS